MKYWDWIVHFHERVYKDCPTGEEGLKAVKFLRSFFEKMGKTRKENNVISMLSGFTGDISSGVLVRARLRPHIIG